ncbi:MAG: hypothetical protein ACMUIL_08875 [bacterium]
MSKNKRFDEAIENFSNYNYTLSWNLFVKVLTKHYGFEKDEKRAGAAVAFVKSGLPPLTVHKPHGREKTVSKEDRKKAIRFINAFEAREEQ